MLAAFDTEFYGLASFSLDGKLNQGRIKLSDRELSKIYWVPWRKKCLHERKNNPPGSVSPVLLQRGCIKGKAQERQL